MRVDPHYIANLTQSLGMTTAAEQKLTTQLSSGLRLTTLSDDPSAAAQNVSLSQSISGQDSYVQSAGLVEGMLQVTDSTLGDVVSTLTSAISLGVEAGGGTLNASNLASIAKSVGAIRDTMVGLANSSYAGTYLFSGSKGNLPPFVQDSTTNPATTSYQGDQITQSIVTPQGQKIQTNLPGSTIFAGAGGDVLNTLNQMVTSLQNGDLSGIAATTTALTNALNNVSTQRSELGGSLSRITATSSYAGTQETQFKALESNLLASDPATIATDLQTAEVQHQALISVIAELDKAPQLFSMLQ